MSSWSATGRELADGPPLCRTQDRGACGHRLQSSASPPPRCWAPPRCRAPHVPPEGRPEQGVQKCPPGPPGPPPDACREAQGSPTGTSEVSVCGNQEELWQPPVTRHIPTGKPTGSGRACEHGGDQRCVTHEPPTKLHRHPGEQQLETRVGAGT